MIIKINEKEYEVSTNLGTAYDIEHKYNKNIRDIISSVDDLDMEHLISLLYIGFKRKNQDIKEEEFKNLVLDNFNYLDFMKEITVFCELCMTTGKTEEEVRKQIGDLFDKNLKAVDTEISEITIEDGDQKN